METSSEHKHKKQRTHAARWLAGGLAVVLAAKAPDLYAQIRVAVVDVQRVLITTDDGRHAREQLVAQAQKQQADLNARTEALRGMQTEITKRSENKSISEKEVARLNDEYKRKLVDFENAYLQYQQALSQREAELTKRITDNLKVIVQQYGADNNYTAIIDQSAVIWSADGLDVTDQVVQRYNVRFPPHDELPSPTDATPGSTTPAAQSTTPANSTTTPRTTTPARPTPVANPHPREESGNAQPPPKR